jgi:glucose-1-phosphate cytidylyltransferase
MGIPAVILCGGLGTRLREETEYRPKAMIDVGGKPILWHILKIYSAGGVNDFVLCLGYKGQMIKDYFLNYRGSVSDFTIKLGEHEEIQYHTRPESIEEWRVTCADTGLDTQTGARARAVLRYIHTDVFCLTYGDGLGDVDVRKLVEFHRSHGKIGTLTAVKASGRFGELRLSRSGGVLQFDEKPEDSGGYINGGFFVFDTKRFPEYLPPGDDLVLERGPLEGLARDGELMAYRHDGFWQCMDTYREWRILTDLWNSGSPPWAVWRRPDPL